MSWVKRHWFLSLWIFSLACILFPPFQNPQTDLGKTLLGICYLVFLGGIYIAFAAIVGALQALTLSGIGKAMRKKD